MSVDLPGTRKLLPSMLRLIPSHTHLQPLLPSNLGLHITPHSWHHLLDIRLVFCFVLSFRAGYSVSVERRRRCWFPREVFRLPVGEHVAETFRVVGGGAS